MSVKKLSAAEFARHTPVVAMSADAHRLNGNETDAEERESIRAFLIEGVPILGEQEQAAPISDADLFDFTKYRKRGEC